MRLEFSGDTEELRSGIALLEEKLSIGNGGKCITVYVERTGDGIAAASYDGVKGRIRYSTRIQFFRALGLFAEQLRSDEFSGGGSFNIEEKPYFITVGVMVDASRNAVPSVKSIKRLLVNMALMGLNLLMLYTEDTYEIKDLPYFGYMRGRYTFEELKECDDYADVFGIEMVPCIQTLAHLSQVLKWNEFSELRDTADIVLADDDRTYEFIGNMIESASAPFRSRRIHLGMDEAHFMGLGRYLDRNGYCNRFQLMNRHLKRVVGITERLGLKPMIWSDMFFTLGSRKKDYFDPDSVIPGEIAEAMPGNVQQVYWDYYHNDTEHYSIMINKHREIGIEPLFAGGIWSFAGVAVNYAKTLAASNAALSACRRDGVREVFATIWNDDGAETNLFASLLGIQLFAENSYSDKPDMKRLKRRFEFCTGGSFEAFMELSCFDTIPGAEQESITGKPANPSKYLLWQDILTGLFDRYVQDIDIGRHYSELAARMKHHAAGGGEWDAIFDMPYRLCDVLAVKGNLGLRIRELYLSKDLPGLRKIANESLPLLYECIEKLRCAHRAQWFKTYKPFGWEVLDIRYGGLMARIASARARLIDYMDGRIETIEELDEERLYFDGTIRTADSVLCRCNQYNRIVSACMM